jgi:hypothetical protein
MAGKRGGWRGDSAGHRAAALKHPRRVGATGMRGVSFRSKSMRLFAQKTGVIVPTMLKFRSRKS